MGRAGASRGRSAARTAVAAVEAAAPFEIVQTADRGKSAVAARPLPPGATVLEEDPLLTLDFTGDPAGDVLSTARRFHALPADAQEAVMGLAHLDEASIGLMTAFSLSPPSEAELPAGMTAEDVQRLVAIVDCNVLKVVDLDALSNVGHEDVVACALYERLSRFNHSCRPNLIRRFQADGHVRLQTSRAVAAGEELTISYLGDAELLHSTARRRWQLQPWGFTCDCERCVVLEDPARVFRCPQCEAGKVLAGPGDADLAGRRCRSCGEAMGASEAAQCLAAEQSALFAFEIAKNSPNPPDLGSTAARVEAGIEGAGDRLAPQHWALGMLHNFAQSLHSRRGDPAGAARHLEAKLRFLEASHPGPLHLGLREWDQAACGELLAALRKEAR